MNSIEVELGDDKLGEIVDELLSKMARGEAVDVEQYAKQYPEAAEVLRHAIPALQAVAMSGSSRDGVNAATVNSDTGNTSDGFTPGRTLGDFKLVRELGRGGMGVVYEAEEMSLGRNVALKILPFAGIVDERAQQRFRNEVRAAAALDHPNIVSVHSAGEQRGVHYYAMQLVRGQTMAEVIHELSQFKNGHVALSGDSISRILSSKSESPAPSGTDPTEALADAAKPQFAELCSTDDTVPVAQKCQPTLAASTSGSDPHFYRSVAILGVQAANALQHAHDNGVLHRDIKPGNLMLDAQSQLYVTDFGLARIETDAAMTMTGDLIGTLRYMSPEQALAKRVVIDQRSEIYSLGATLYEMLALRPVFSGNDRQALLKQIAFKDPVKLRKIDRAISSDLETIIHKALAKNPDERYTTSEEFAADLQAFVEHRPITARPPTPLQRLGKWSRRNRGLVASLAATGAICLVALVVSNIMIAGQKTLALQAAADEKTQRQNAERERDAAEQARNEAQDVTKFLVDAFRSPDPEKDGRTVTVAEVLDRAVERIDSQEALTPGRKASLRDAIGRTYFALGLAQSAIPLFEQVREFRHKDLGEQDPRTLDAMYELALAYVEVGRLHEGLELLKQTLQLKRKVVGERHSSTLATMAQLAYAYHRTGEYAAEIQLTEQVYRITREQFGERHGNTLNSMNGLAFAYQTAGRYEDAIEMYKQTLSLRRNKYGDRHPHTLSTMAGLALSLRTAGQTSEAIDLFEKTLKLRREVIGERHPDTLNLMGNLAQAYDQSANRNQEAAELFEQTLKLRREVMGERHPDTLHSMAELANSYAATGRADEAVELHRQTLDLRREVLGEQHPMTLYSQFRLGLALNDAGNHSESATLLENVLKLLPEKFGEQHGITLGAMTGLARAYGVMGRHEDAAEVLESALRGAREQYGDRHPVALEALGYLALAYGYAGGHEEQAVELYDELLELRREVFGRLHPMTIATTVNRCTAYADAGRRAEASDLFDKAIKLLRSPAADREQDQNRMQRALASALANAAANNLHLRADEKAEVQAREALEMRERLIPDQWLRFCAQSLLGRALLGQGKVVAAEKHLLAGFEEMKNRIEDIPDSSRNHLFKTCEAVIELYEGQGNDEQVEYWKQTLERLKISRGDSGN